MISPLIWIAVAVLLIARQFQPHALKSRVLLVGPLILGFFGLQGLAQVQGLDAIIFLAVNAGIAVAFGAWRGFTFRVWAQGGEPWLQGTLATLALWVASIAVRAVLVAAGHAAGISMATNMAELMILLALTLGAQNAVLWMRTMGRSPLLA